MHNVEWITPEDHRLMGSSKLYMEEFNHRVSHLISAYLFTTISLSLVYFCNMQDDEPEAEHVPQIIKSQSFAVKEASTHHCNLMPRHNV